MKKSLIITGLSFLFLGTMTSTALAQTAPAVQPTNGILQQPPAVFMDAPPVPVSVNPTFTQQVRAENLLIHEEDTLEIGSPEYKNAHRLLVSNLRMLERQLSFNPVDLARFNATTHPARSTVDQTIYSPDGINSYAPHADVDTGAVAFVTDVAFLSSDGSVGYHQRAGEVLTRRSIIAAANEQNLLHILAMAQ